MITQTETLAEALERIWMEGRDLHPSFSRYSGSLIRASIANGTITGKNAKECGELAGRMSPASQDLPPMTDEERSQLTKQLRRLEAQL